MTSTTWGGWGYARGVGAMDRGTSRQPFDLARGIRAADRATTRVMLPPDWLGIVVRDADGRLAVTIADDVRAADTAAVLRHLLDGHGAGDTIVCHADVCAAVERWRRPVDLVAVGVVSA